MSKFFRRGKSGTFWLPAATITGPTAAQITAGIDLSPAVLSVSGLERTPQKQNVQVQAYQDEQNMTSGFQFGDAQLGLLDDDGTGTAAEDLALRAALAGIVIDASGYLVMSPTKRTPIVGTKVDIWPATIRQITDSYDFGNSPASSTVFLDLSGTPARRVAVVA